ncbi:MAG: anthranilate phosphoribosyltransferase [Alphaproteobacteria bacterium]|nr:anthranilate phosphoribosyltransferase [Alphaproteobacteria bacterium]
MSEALRTCLMQFAAGERPGEADMAAALEAIMEGAAGEAELGGWLTALAMAGEQTEDVVLGARALRTRMTRVCFEGPLLDVCGTGGDGAHTLNVSTAAALILAGCGLRVAKHGNRAMSSKTGAADVLAALGVRLDADAAAQGRAMREAGVAFLFAQTHHPAMRHVAGARKALGFRTLFNMLGPLANPAGAQRQLLGVYHRKIMPLVAEASRILGSEKVWVVHGAQGVDEIAPMGVTHVIEATPAGLRSFDISPADAGLAEGPLEALRGGDAAYNAAALRRLLAGERSVYRDCAVLNAAAALMVADRAATLKEGAALAARSIDSGAASEALRRLAEATGGPDERP